MTGEAGLDPLLHALPAGAHEAIFWREIVPDVLDVAPPVPDPWVIILGGRAGSGKTYLKRSLLLDREHQDHLAGRPAARPVDLGTDELRDYHPRWRRLLRDDDITAAFYTAHDCRRWVDEAVAYCTARHLSEPGLGGPKSLVLDTQLNDPDRARELISRFRASGYRTVHVAFAAVSVPMSQLGALQRYWEQRQHLGGGRFAADPGASDPGILATAEMIDREHLADIVEVHRRGDTAAVYRNVLTGRGRWQNQPRTPEALTAEWNRPWDREESIWFAERCAELADQLGQRWWPELADATRRAASLSHPDVDLSGLARRLASREPPAPGSATAGRAGELPSPPAPAPGGRAGRRSGRQPGKPRGPQPGRLPQLRRPGPKNC